MIKQGLSALNKLINKTLNYSDNKKQLLQPLLNKVVAIHIIGMEKTVYCLFSENEILITDQNQDTINTKISGGPFSLLNIMLSKNLSVSGVYIEGEIDTAQQCRQLAEECDIDWETLFADKIGDTPSYYLAKLGKKLQSYRQDQQQQFQDNLADYLKDEKQLLVTPQQVAQHCNDIDECRFRVDRLTARINNLQQRCQS